MGKRYNYELYRYANESVSVKLILSLSKQKRKEQVGLVKIDRNEVCHVIKMLNTNILGVFLTCSYNTSFLFTILIIMDGDGESIHRLNGIYFSMKEQG